MLRLLLVCFVLTGSPVFCNLLNLVHPHTESTPERVVERFSELDKNIRNILETVLQQAVPLILRSSSEVELSGECQASLFKLILGTRQLKDWAINMLDAMGKIPSGLTSGSSSDLGAYDQCLDIAVKDDYDPDHVVFRGQYCGIEIRPPLPPKADIFYRMDQLIYPMENVTSTNPVLQLLRSQGQMFYFLSIRIGACVPSTCTKKDVANVVGAVTKMIGVNGNVSRCEVREPIKIDNVQIAVLSVVGVLIFLSAVGTTVDIICAKLNPSDPEHKHAKTTTRICLCFSVPRNTKNLLKTSGGPETSVNVLHGLKFLSITWIILGHTYLYLNWQILRNLLKSQSYIQDFAFQAVVNAFVSVDSFFFASGFLISYLTILHVDKNGKQSFNIPIFFLRRIFRFLPSTCMLVALTFLLPLIGSGPLFHETIDVLADSCRRNWWANLLFVNNFFYTPDACQPNTWYTACDVQLYFISVIFLLLVFNKPKWSVPFLGLMILGSVVSASAINYWQNLPPALLIVSPDPEGIFTYWYYAHFLPHVHLGSYAIGLGLGYFIIRHKDFTPNMPYKIIGWSLAVACNVTVLYATYLWNGIRPATLVESLLYSGLHRPAWIAGVAWMIYACTKGFGGLVNSILSWPGFIPLSKLTFMAYLWHGTVIWLYMANQEAAIETNHLAVIWMYLGHLVTTFALSFVFHILYEAPFIQLERIVLGGNSKRKTVKNGHNETLNGDSKTAKKMKEAIIRDHNPMTEITNGSFVCRM